MNLFEKSFFSKYLLPGFVFQSVVIGGGYGTGRELVEFFLAYGPLGGFLGMLFVTTITWSLFLALTFVFAHTFGTYDYRTFFKKLLGPFWPIYEIIYIIFLIIVLAVIGAASGRMFAEHFQLPYIYTAGVIVMLVAVGFLTFKGTGLIEKFLSIWSFLLYAVYIVFFIITIIKLGDVVRANFSACEIKPGWIVSSLKYAFYNLSIGPVILFCLKHIQTRKQALSAGIIAGVIGIFPALLFYVALVAYYPAVNDEDVPSLFAFQQIAVLPLFIVFQVVLYGTLVETGTAMIHSVNERIQSALQAHNKALPKKLRPVIAIVFLLFALAASMFGLKDLIAKGYGTACWGFFWIYLVPLITWGLYKILKSSPSAPSPSQNSKN